MFDRGFISEFEIFQGKKSYVTTSTNRFINGANDAVMKQRWMTHQELGYFLDVYFHVRHLCPVCKLRLFQMGQFQMLELVDNSSFKFRFPVGKGCYNVAMWYNSK